MTTVKLSDELVNEAKRYAKMQTRSTPKQIEYWARIGKAAVDNPDLPVPFIMDILESLEDTVTIPFTFSSESKPKGKKKPK